MVAILFSHFRVMNVKLVNEKNFLVNAVSKLDGCVILLRLLYLACIV